MEKAILIVDEVAELLRVDRQRIYELVRTNQLPVIRLGQRQYRFDSDAIHRWLNAGGNREMEPSTEDVMRPGWDTENSKQR